MVAPLNWGLGHATRCTRIIDILLQKNVDVLLAADGGAFNFLKLRYPQLEILRFPGYEIQYAKGGRLMLNAIFRLPGFLRSIKAEHETLTRLIADKKPGAIISDNRYGLWSDKIPSYLITHQVGLTAGGIWKVGIPIANRLLDFYFKRFHGLWIPDTADFPGLAGKLSHRDVNGQNVSFVGFLSRFTGPAPADLTPAYDLAVILSGPEPQRSVLERKLLSLIAQTGIRAAMVRGLPGATKPQETKSGVVIYPHLPDEEFELLFRQSRHILCRSGYSSLMDLMQLQRSALIIPTPGQPEQEYLAKLHRESNQFDSLTEAQLTRANLGAFVSGSGKKRSTSKSQPFELQKTIDELISLI